MAARRARAVRSKLLEKDGPFAELSAKHRLGHDVKLYLNPDKNARKVAEETAGRRLVRLAKAASEGHAEAAELAWERRGGRVQTLLCKSTPVLQLTCPTQAQSRECSLLQRHATGPERAGVAAIVDAVIEAFRDPASEPPRDDANWYSV